MEKGGTTTAATLKLEAEKRGTPLDCRKNETITDSINAESNQDYSHADSVSPSLNTFNLDLEALLDSIPTPPPQGWEQIELGQLLSYERPDAYIVGSENYNNEYKIPVLTAGKTFILGYTNEINNIYKDVPVIIFDDFTTATQFVDFEFKVKSSAMKILKNRNDKVSNIRFVFYAMQTIKLNLSLALRRYWISMYKDIKIPLPPLSVQEKIVNAIEMIKAQIAIIDSKLESLEARKAQILESALSEGNEREREREQAELKEILREIESLLLQKAFLQSLITQILQKVETPANLESLLDSIPNAYHTRHHIYRPEPLDKVSSNTESRLTIINEANNQSIESDLDSIPTPPPHGWEVKTLGEVLEHIDTQSLLPKESEFQYLGLEHIQKGGKLFKPIKTDSKTIKSNSIVLKKGYIYYSKLRPYLKKIFYYNLSEKCYASSELIGLKFKENEICPLFAFNILLSDFISKQEQSTSGARMPRLNLDDIKNFKIPLPPLSVQEKIVTHIQKIESSIAATQEKIKALELELERYIESTL